MSQQAPLHSEEIKARIRIRFGSLSAFEVARELPAGSAKDVLRGRSVRRTADAIADELGIPVTQLFPNLSTKADDTAGKASAHRLNSGAV